MVNAAPNLPPKFDRIKALELFAYGSANLRNTHPSVTFSKCCQAMQRYCRPNSCQKIYAVARTPAFQDSPNDQSAIPSSARSLRRNCPGFPERAGKPPALDSHTPGVVARKLSVVTEKREHEPYLRACEDKGRPAPHA